VTNPRSAADRAVLNAHVRTLDPERPRASALAIRGGTIIAVGSDAEIRAVCDGATELIDGAGATVVPGLVDGHIHPLNADGFRGADLTRCSTLVETQAALARERERVGDDGWVRGWGLDYGAFHGSEISGEAIAQAVRGAPAFVMFMDFHTAVATPRALELAGVSGPRQFAEGAEVVVRDGRPTGELREAAALELVRKVMPPLTAQESYQMIVDLHRRLNAVGLTGIHVMDGTPGSFDLLRELEGNGDLTLRTVVPLWQTPETSFEEMEHHIRLRDEHGHLWRGGVAKFFIDGVIDTGTGWLYEPDELGGGTLPFWPDPTRYAKAVEMFAAAGFQCVTHATGDRGVREALDAYRRAGAAPGVTHRVEHIETLRDDDLPRFAAEGVAASMQPLHMQWRRGDLSDSWAARLGPDRASRAFRTQDLARSGALIPLGSDWPVAQYDPRIGMAWAQLRRTPGEPDGHVFEPEQRLGPEQTLAGYTIANATVIGAQATSGRVAVGFRADLTAFAADPISCPPDELPDLPITLTVVDGRIVHQI
jgi:predicted amidohydrolase YtcJ